MSFIYGRVYFNLETLLQSHHLVDEPDEETLAGLQADPTMIETVRQLLHRCYDVNILAFVRDSSFVFPVRKWVKAVIPDMWEYTGLPEKHILAIPKTSDKLDYISYPRRPDVYIEHDPKEAVEWRKIGTPVLLRYDNNTDIHWNGYMIDTCSMGEYIANTIRGILHVEELQYT